MRSQWCGAEGSASAELAARFAMERVAQRRAWAARAASASRVSAVPMPASDILRARTRRAERRHLVQGALAASIAFGLTGALVVSVLTRTDWAAVQAWDPRLAYTLVPAGIMCLVGAMLAGTVAAAVARRGSSLMSVVLMPCLAIVAVACVWLLVAAGGTGGSAVLDTWALIVAVMAGFVAATGSRTVAVIGETL